MVISCLCDVSTTYDLELAATVTVPYYFWSDTDIPLFFYSFLSFRAFRSGTLGFNSSGDMELQFVLNFQLIKSSDGLKPLYSGVEDTYGNPGLEVMCVECLNC